MNLLLLRHADALPGHDDAARPLSDRGEDEAKRVGRFLDKIGFEIDLAYSSPLIRARETAEIVVKKCGKPGRGSVELSDALLNETSFTAFGRWLKTLPVSGNILLVGHDPSISERLCKLLKASDSSAFKMRKGAVAILESEDLRSFRLQLFLAPKQLPE